MQPLISIITITYNAEKFIERTLKSVTEQTYPNIEYIIVDGKSKDNTLEIVKKYENKISKVVSESDKGLYDAMNKGIELASGDYINFMNAGDTFFSNETLSNVFNSHHNQEDFVYGDTVIVNEEGQERPLHKSKPEQKKMSYKQFADGMVICHQSMFVKRELAVPYDFSQFKMACDIEWAIKVAKKSKTFRDSGVYVSKFLDGGFSTSNVRKAIKERFWISVHHFGWPTTLYHQSKIALETLVRKLINQPKSAYQK